MDLYSFLLILITLGLMFLIIGGTLFFIVMVVRRYWRSRVAQFFHVDSSPYDSQQNLSVAKRKFWRPGNAGWLGFYQPPQDSSTSGVGLSGTYPSSENQASTDHSSSVDTPQTTPDFGSGFGGGDAGGGGSGGSWGDAGGGDAGGGWGDAGGGDAGGGWGDAGGGDAGGGADSGGGGE